MPNRAYVLLLLALSWSCGSSSGPPTDSGPLVDNSKWVPTSDGDDVLGPPPPDAECELTPIDCPEYPWPEGECVNFDDTSTCVAAYVPECEQSLTVLSVYTRMPDDRVSLCNWITLEQPSLRDIRVGDEVEVRTLHSALTAPVPGDARMTFVVGDQIAYDFTTLIPAASSFPSETWTADKDYPAGTPLLWHVNNHGRNEYMLIEVNVCDPETTELCL